jgi:hypothetical protein
VKRKFFQQFRLRLESAAVGQPHTFGGKRKQLSSHIIRVEPARPVSQLNGFLRGTTGIDIAKNVRRDNAAA